MSSEKGRIDELEAHLNLYGPPLEECLKQCEENGCTGAEVIEHVRGMLAASFECANALPMPLTLRRMQRKQPWTIPYSPEFNTAYAEQLPHLMASHAVLHAVKTVGKLAAVYEKADHGESSGMLGTVRDMSADLVTVAVRLANLHGFDLEEELNRRVTEKNGRAFEGEDP